MKKRLLATALSIAAAISMTACSAAGSTAPASDAAAQPAATPAAETAQEAPAAGEPYEIKMALSYILTPPGDEAVQATEDVINDYLKNTLGIDEFKVDLKILSITDANTIIPMDLAAGQELDIINVGSRNISNYVANGYLMPLDDYLDNELKDAYEIVKDFMICFYQNDHYYALATWSGQIGDYRLIYNKDMVDAVCDMSEVDTWDEVLDVLEQLKEAYPDEHFVANSSVLPAIYSIQDHTCTVGNYLATVGDSTDLVNYYATDAYRLACEKAYELRQKGMVDPEGSSQTMGADALCYSGSTKGVIMCHPLTAKTISETFTLANTYGATFDAVTFGRTPMPNAIYSFGIPYTSGNPSAAAKLLNLIWTDEFLYNTLGFGVEGKDYLWNEDHTEIYYPEGLTQQTVDYNCIFLLAGLGDQRMIWHAPGGTSAEDVEFIKEQMSNCYIPPAYGFAPSTANVANQIAAVSNVVDQYNNALIYGDVDPAEFLPKFLQELDNAGMNDIIADYQAQLDTWLAENK